MIEPHRVPGANFDRGYTVVKFDGLHLCEIKEAEFAATDECGCGMQKCRGGGSNSVRPSFRGI